MKTICFYFQVHQPFRLRRYRFFDIGQYHNYFDEYANRSIMRKIADKCYLPTNKLILSLINEFGNRFRVSYSISGTALDQFEMYAPDVLDSFRKLAETGCVEFIAETSSHSLSSLTSRSEFEMQVLEHSGKIEELFGKKPTTFRNSELIYSDEIGSWVADMGYKAMLTEGAKHILGWKSSNYLYTNAINPKLKLLLKNFQMSDDIAFRFSNRGWSEWPLTTEKYVGWLNSIGHKDEIVNIFMDYETFGERQWAETGIFEFLKTLPKRVFSDSNFEFLTPAEAAQKHQPIASIHVPHPISWADEERDVTAWLGNEMQNEAFENLYKYSEVMREVTDPEIIRDWRYLQTSNHFYYMSTKWFSDGDVHKYFNPYESPYEAFINFMNAFSDFKLRVDSHLGGEPVEQGVSKQKPEQEDVDTLISKYETKLRELKAIKAKKQIARKTVSKASSTKKKAVAVKAKVTSPKKVNDTKSTKKVETNPAKKASPKKTVKKEVKAPEKSATKEKLAAKTKTVPKKATKTTKKGVSKKK